MEMDRVLEAFRNCITEPKCRDCPWEECEKFENKKVKIPVDLALSVDALLAELLKKQESVKPTRTVSNHDYHYDYCGYCGCLLPVHGETYGKQARFCPYCGKSVDWST